ncbi:MAG TPA: pyruvoyl-dependent arginine decarboxylase [Candidatus Saccharimonadales bacterium]|nr:pyruvoyl-dependent arginine decarboxylase [Candidatus Saccharimonadales bacterium]
MHIQISSGLGVGPTELAAFDQSLVKAGVANYNLIYLSSVLPPNSNITEDGKPKLPDGNWGDRLYVVIAQKRVSQRNQEAWAGIGWMQDPKSGTGLLVEHEGHSENEVKADITNSLSALAKNRNMTFGKHQMHVVGSRCIDYPVCALVVAVYESTTWRANRHNHKLGKFKFKSLATSK